MTALAVMRRVLAGDIPAGALSPELAGTVGELARGADVLAPPAPPAWYRVLIEEAASMHGVPPELLAALEIERPSTLAVTADDLPRVRADVQAAAERFARLRRSEGGTAAALLAYTNGDHRAAQAIAGTLMLRSAAAFFDAVGQPS